ncbi:hypothetical protein EI94DRAFT_1701983 [Lactarius quietus]|nr:hypothetical protein EI94DRAFT_1701983 [Lactarius quietus]
MPLAAPNLCTDTSQAQEHLVAASSANSNMPRREKCQHASMSGVRREICEQWLQDQQQRGKPLTTLMQCHLLLYPRKMQEVMKIRKAARLQENAKGRFATKIGFPKVKGMNGKVRRKWVKKTWSRKNVSPSLKVNLNKTWEDEPGPLEESQNETGEAQGKDDNKTIKELKMEVEALKSRCNGYEREIRDLQGTCDMHENVLEMLWQQIMHLMDAQGILNTTYGGKSYVLIP